LADHPLTLEDGARAAFAQPREREALANAWYNTRKFVRNKPLGAAGAFVLISMVIMALGAEWIAPYDPLTPDTTAGLDGPSLDHPAGTDQLGRDMLSRIIHGAKPSLYTGLMVVSIGSMIGMLLGATSAYLGGYFDLVVQRFVDAMLAFPGLVFAIAFLTIFSNGLEIGGFIDLPAVWQSTPVMVVIALIILTIPTSSRVVRGATFGIINTQYVEAARAVGCSTTRIVLRHLIPNIFPVVIVIASVQLGNVILIESALSFLGLGLPPPNPSWGDMLSRNRAFMETAPWLAIFPGIAISLAVLSFNLFGDALRDVLDPRLRGASGAGSGLRT